MASDKQKKYLCCLAEDIQVFILTMAKSGKQLKCTGKKSLIGDEWMENEDLVTYLIDQIRDNLSLLKLEFVDANFDGESREDRPLNVRSYRSFELKLSEEGVRMGKKFKLPIHYFFYHDQVKQCTFFGVK